MRRQIILDGDNISLGRRLAPGIVSVISKSTPPSPPALPQVIKSSLEPARVAASAVVSKLPVTAPVNISVPVDPRIAAQMARISPPDTSTMAAAILPSDKLERLVNSVSRLIPVPIEKIRNILSSVRLPAIALLSAAVIAGLVYLAYKAFKGKTAGETTEKKPVSREDINKAMSLITSGRQMSSQEKASLMTQLLALAETNDRSEFIEKAAAL